MNSQTDNLIDLDNYVAAVLPQFERDTKRLFSGGAYLPPQRIAWLVARHRLLAGIAARFDELAQQEGQVA